MSLIKVNARSASALDATILTGNLPSISGASLTGVSAGKILKVANATSTSQTTLGQSYSSIINLNFTPTASNSTLYLFGNLQMYLSGTGSYHSNVRCRFLDDTASSNIAEEFDVYQGYGGGSADLGNLFTPMHATYASWGTSARDIKIDAKRPEAAGTGVINQYTGKSSLTIMEVSA